MLNNDLAKAINTGGLDSREQEVLERRLGIGHTAQSLQQIGDELGGLSRERIRQLEKGAYEKLGMGSSKDSIQNNRLVREERNDKLVMDIFARIEPIRLAERKNFRTIAKKLGMNYASAHYTQAVQLFYKRHGHPELLSDRDKEMIEYKMTHPFITQVDLARKFKVHNPTVCRKFKRMGIPWNDVRALAGYVKPTLK